MPKKITPVAKNIVVLLNNVCELIEHSNKRSEASDVMHAIKIYSEGKNFSIPHDKFELFDDILLDSRPNTLTDLVRNIVSDIVRTGKA